VDVVEDVQGQGGASLTVRAILDGGQGLSGASAKRSGLANGLATGGPRLGDLPEGGPEGEPKGPATAAGVRAVVALGEEVVRDPALEEQLELVQEVRLAGGAVAAEPVVSIGEEGGKRGEIRRHLGQRIYCPIDRNDTLKG
jgi:hypothetical protein